VIAHILPKSKTFDKVVPMRDFAEAVKASERCSRPGYPPSDISLLAEAGWLRAGILKDVCTTIEPRQTRAAIGYVNVAPEGSNRWVHEAQVGASKWGLRRS
jgi:hypothetical protein